MFLLSLFMLQPGQAMSATAAAKAVANNLKFDGTLVDDPCQLDPNTTDITLDFGTVIDKYLYLNTRTHSQPFTLRLQGCDTTLGNQVEITFKGTESNELPGLLTLSQSSASGIAIGMEMADGTSIPFNKTLPAFALTNGVSTITLQSYVQGEPSAITNHNIGRGTFKAVATFELNYP
ncbi:fimbrial protein [Salmonella enterica]